MKVDLHITDATPEEILHFFGRCQNQPATTNTLKKNIRKAKSGFSIPFASGTPEYQRAMRLCKKFGLPYDFALERITPEKEHFVPAADIKPSGIHWKKIIKNSVNPPHEPMIPDTGDN